MPDPDNMASRRAACRGSARITIPCLLLAATTAAVYAPVLDHDFVSLDDRAYVTENPHVRAGFTAASLSWAATTFHVSNWHPLTWMSHMLDVELYGLGSGGHHLSAMLLHILNTLLLFGILNRAGPPGAPGWPHACVAALFALHPLHVESVAWISERKDVLSTALGLLSIWAYVAFARRGGVLWYLLAIGAMASSLCAKAMLVTLPFLFMLLDYWPLGRWRRRHRLVALCVEKIPFLLLSCLSATVTYVAQSADSVADLQGLPLPVRLGNAVVSYASYIGKTIWPSDLSVLYPHPTMPGSAPWSAWQITGSAALLLALSCLAIVTARRRPWVIVGWLWFVGLLVPVNGLVQVGFQAMADRYTYLPLVGLFMIVAWGGHDLAGRFTWHRARMRGAMAAVAMVLLTACVVRSRHQVSYWRNSIALYGQALRVTPDNPIMLRSMGQVLQEAGRFEAAILNLRRAVDISPHYPEALLHLAYTQQVAGRLDEAMRLYRRILRIDPGHVTARTLLGDLLQWRGAHDEALAQYDQALRADPRHGPAHYGLGRVLHRQGELDKAIHHLRQAAQLLRDAAQVHHELGLALQARGEVAKAIERFGVAIRLDPSSARTHYDLATALRRQGALAESVRHYRAALRLAPREPRVHTGLAAALAAAGQIDEARRIVHRALELAEASGNEEQARAIRDRLAEYESRAR